MTNLAAALDEFKPQIAASYADIVRHQFARMAKEHGNTLKGVHNSWTFAKLYRNLVYENLSLDRVTKVYSLDETRLVATADRYAAEAVAAWSDKIQAKLGTLDGVIVQRMNGVAFSITGLTLIDGRRVRITQQMILNVSSQGKPFNQFPARIYIEGKLVSAAMFKRLAA